MTAEKGMRAACLVLRKAVTNDTFDDVLVPIDGSRRDRRAVRQALELVTDDGTLHLFHVVDIFDIVGDVRGTASVPAYRRKCNEAEQFVTTAAERVDGHETVQTVTEGITSVEIVRAAAKRDVDAVVMVTREQHRRVPKFLFPSTTARVVNRSDVPVVAVPENS